MDQLLLILKKIKNTNRSPRQTFNQSFIINDTTTKTKYSTTIMAKPLFPPGRKTTELLVSALLAHADQQILLSDNIFLQPTKKNVFQLRVRAEITVLADLIRIYIQSNSLITQQQEIAQEFLELNESEQINQIKNAITCMIKLQLAVDERAIKCNKPMRMFSLELKHRLFGTNIFNNVKYILDKWDENRKRNPAQTTLVQKLVSVAATHFPKKLYSYTSDIIAYLNLTVPQLEDIVSESPSEEVLKIFSSLILFHIANSRLAKATELINLSSKYFTKPLEIAQQKNLLGRIYYQEGNYLLAEKSFNEAIKIYGKKLGKTHPDLADSIHNLGLVYLALKKHPDSENSFKIAIALKQRKPALEIQDHLEIANSYNGLGDALYQLRLYESAIRNYEQAKNLVEQYGGSFHPFLVSSQMGIANILTQWGEYEKAVILYQEAIALIEKLYGLTDFRIAQPTAALGAVYFKMGDQAMGNRLYQEAIDLLTNKFGAHYPVIGLYRSDLANLNC